MGLTVASVAYPFAPVTADPVGGAEQILARLDHALTDAGHRSIVIAPEGSAVAGELLPVPAVTGAIDDTARARTHAAVRTRVDHAIAEGADLIHLHGIDFLDYLPPPGPPVLATLHLPLDWYPPDALRPDRPRTYLQPVSASQAARAPGGAALTDPIENGVEIPDMPARKLDYAFMLGRVCPEKGFDDAIDAAVQARSPLLMAGRVYPYPAHQDYFAARILPRLDACRRWLGAVAGRRKAWLLASARCLLVPSKAPETSSLVAMEALAAGTPVIAYRAGALPDIVEHGRTGFLVDGVDEMADAIRAADRIDPAECRARARERFPLRRMINGYLGCYRELTS